MRGLMSVGSFGGLLDLSKPLIYDPTALVRPFGETRNGPIYNFCDTVELSNLRQLLYS